MFHPLVAEGFEMIVPVIGSGAVACQSCAYGSASAALDLELDLPFFLLERDLGC